jgi:hypothetical protein
MSSFCRRCALSRSYFFTALPAGRKRSGKQAWSMKMTTRYRCRIARPRVHSCISTHLPFRRRCRWLNQLWPPLHRAPIQSRKRSCTRTSWCTCWCLGLPSASSRLSNHVAAWTRVRATFGSIRWTRAGVLLGVCARARGGLARTHSAVLLAMVLLLPMRFVQGAHKTQRAQTPLVPARSS